MVSGCGKIDNNTNIKIPKKYQDRIKEIYHDEDGYWVILNKGWFCEDYGLHTIHEDTQQDILRCIRETESCDYCKQGCK